MMSSRGRCSQRTGVASFWFSTRLFDFGCGDEEFGGCVGYLEHVAVNYSAGGIVSTVVWYGESVDVPGRLSYSTRARYFLYRRKTNIAPMIISIPD